MTYINVNKLNNKALFFLCLVSKVANLGISEELQAKLQDVMITRTLLSIGKVLGEGE